MILAIDVGNTNIVVGAIDHDRKTLFIERLSTVKTKTETEYAIDLKIILDLYHIDPTQMEGGIISCVVPGSSRKNSEKEGTGCRAGGEKRTEYQDGQPGIGRQ